MSAEDVTVPERVRVAVIGAGQAGLSAAYFLYRCGLVAQDPDGFVVLDHNPGPGGAWQHRWPTLRLSTVNGVHDLPGLAMADVIAPLVDEYGDIAAARAVPAYFGAYEEKFDLAVRRPVGVREVRSAGTPPGGFEIETTHGTLHAAGIVNATGTWERPFWPYYPGQDSFRGRQLHTADYRGPAEFAGQHVLVVGAGISALNLLTEISAVTTTSWVTRTPPHWSDEPFTPARGREAVARVEDRVRVGLPPHSVVSVTGLMKTPALLRAEERGALDRREMFTRITGDGVAWADGTTARADVILWCTGFRSALDHLAPLRLRGAGGGIVMDGRLATRVAARPRLHLLGYGPSASTIGANRGGRAASRELLDTLAGKDPEPVDLDLGDGYVIRADTLRPMITDEDAYRAAHPDDPAGELIIAAAAGRLDDALREADRLLTLEPESVRLRALRADVLRDTGELAAAERVYEELLAAADESREPVLLQHLAKVYFAAERFDAAADLFARSHELRRRAGADADVLASAALGLARARQELERAGR
ncbi:MAG: NAD(P)-binding domain-containing protein [Propionibacteriaceae bacterium]